MKQRTFKLNCLVLHVHPTRKNRIQQKWNIFLLILLLNLHRKVCHNFQVSYHVICSPHTDLVVNLQLGINLVWPSWSTFTFAYNCSVFCQQVWWVNKTRLMIHYSIFFLFFTRSSSLSEKTDMTLTLVFTFFPSFGPPFILKWVYIIIDILKSFKSLRRCSCG